MCGFVGYIDKKVNDKNIIKLMNDTIIHRGPDDESYYQDEDVNLGFRRLSIIDLANGRQPMLNKDESIVLTFNGEIYNYQELQEELKNKGYEFKTNSDTETILHGYEEYGTEIVKKLRGMFAFVIWDKNKKRLFGARDYFGIKPFYYYKKDDTFIWGSEIKSFLKHPSFEKKLNRESLKSYLTFQYSVLDETFFENVYRLNPGHYFVYENGNTMTSDFYAVVILRELLKNSKNKNALYDIKCSKVIKDEILKLGGIPHENRTGASYMMDAVMRNNILFGVEYSGHIYFNDNFPPITSGLYAGLKLLEIMSHKKEKLSELTSNTNKYYATSEAKFKFSDDTKFKVIDKVKEYCNSKNYNMSLIDGVKVYFDDGWALVRCSNTGPNVTTRFEANSENRLKEIEKEFLNIINTFN